MIVVGLTGSIGMGKSTVASLLKLWKIPVWEADSVVHTFLGVGGEAVPAVANEFPGASIGEKIDRKKLGQIVFQNEKALEALEKIVHPLVEREGVRFIESSQRRGERMVALDIPLLFETHSDFLCTHTMLVQAPRFVQVARVLRRPGMTLAKMNAILSRQMSDRKKREAADFIINTGISRRETVRQLKNIIKSKLQNYESAEVSRRMQG
ncbi:MAG: dephospho-CoA kinase [Alphaproteobacteria bacterium]|jgi:dephospho-CoA kinase|nr:dephospho-CoA kinase [Alphaproteobacteria bacterium]MBT5389567.1 dephospho-CoA kinase [Alphaproteobacteria bacterium]MBT5654426.1 dephospho-CoA kinase [Alphaproteobacteria bacterium]